MPRARARLLATLLALMGTIIADDAYVLLGGWLVLGLLFLATRTALVAHTKFLVVVVTPISILLFLVWALVIGAPPGEPMGSDTAGALRFASLTTLRLMMLGGLAQLSILTIPDDQLAVVLYRWRLPKEGLIIALATYALAPELRLRAEQVATARSARGLCRRSLLARVAQFPSILVPLFTWVIRSAGQRADTWQQRQLLDRIGILARADEPGSGTGSVVFVVCTAFWCAANIWLRFNT